MRQLLAALFILFASSCFALAEKKLEILGASDESESLVPVSRGGGGLIIYNSIDDDVAIDPRRKIVDFKRSEVPGTIIVKTAQRKLYFVLPGNKAILYPVGVGRDGFAWSGRDRVSRKAEWPDWRPPPEMIKREAEKGHIIPSFMPGGDDNPLGARALYIGSTAFRIHGTTQPKTIGRAVSSGCIRMLNEHVIDLYDRAKVGARVIVE